MNYLIIGAGIAGTTAAETLRAYDQKAYITILTNEAYPLYSRITVPVFASGKVSKEHMILRTQEHFDSKQISFILNAHATAINREHKIVEYEVANTIGKSRVIKYDKLLIATGGTPHAIHIPNSHAKGIFNVHYLDDGTSIYDYASDIKRRVPDPHAIISGGSFIGIDFMDMFLDFGIPHIDFLIKEPWFLHRFLDYDASQIVHSLIEKKGITIHPQTEIQEFLLNEQHEVRGAKTQEMNIQADIVGIGHGINRISSFIKLSGLKINKGIIANEYLQTIDPSIFVAGDVAEYYTPINDDYITAGDWLSARQQAIIAAKNMLGLITPYEAIASNTTSIFGTNLTISGVIDYSKGHTYSRIHGSTYIRIFTNTSNIITGGISIGDNAYGIKIRNAIKDRRVAISIDL